MKFAASVSLIALAVAGCATNPTPPAEVSMAPGDVAVAPASADAGDAAVAEYPLTPEGAAQFVAAADKQLSDLATDVNRAGWINATYITPDTDALAAKFGAEYTELQVQLATQAARYIEVPGLSFDTQRKLNILRQSIVAPAPNIPGAADELATLLTGMQSAYGKGQGTYKGRPTPGVELEALMGTERNPELLKEMWVSWHDNVGAPIKNEYTRFVQISNQGATELGYADTGAMWRSGYDMAPEEFAALTDQLWSQVKPLYDELHCYVRSELNEEYGDAVQPATGPIRADLLGNMWAQEWGTIYDIVAPPGAGDIGYDLTALLKANDYDAEKIVKTGENFFSSLGFAPLPQTFWERSMITKPEDREVVCHASAWDIDNEDDIRIKMCTQVNASDFVTVHHELGHNYYQRAYKDQPFLYKDSANDGFHEAIGDLIALSVTPPYLAQIGLLPESRIPPASRDVGLLLNQAMDSIAFLPFGLLVDKWRWGVFSGEITPATYNQAWTDLRLRYQGIVPPVERTEANFDPGAKFHIPGNTPYTRYFLARLLQFQFYEAACRQAGWTGPLHRCSFYNNKEVGQRLNAMLEMGRSRPWPEALEVFTGSRQMSAEPMIRYFAPLQAWLQQQNRGKQCGW